MHVRKHETWKSKVIKTPIPVSKQDKYYDENLMSNDAGIESDAESEYNQEEVVDTASPEVPPFFWVQTPVKEPGATVQHEAAGLVTRTPQVKIPRTLQRKQAGDSTGAMLEALEEAAGSLQSPGVTLQDRAKELQEATAAGSVAAVSAAGSVAAVSAAGSVAAGSVVAGSVVDGSVTAGSVTAGSVTAGSVLAPQVPKEVPRSQKVPLEDDLLEDEDEAMELRKEKSGSEEPNKEIEIVDGSEEPLAVGSVKLLQQEGTVLRILSTIKPWYRIPQSQEQEAGSESDGWQGQEAGPKEHQELAIGSKEHKEQVAGPIELHEQETGSRELQENGSRELQEQETTGSCELQEQEAVSTKKQELTTGSVEKQEQEAGSKEQQEQKAGLITSQVPSEAPRDGVEEKMRKNLEMFENTMKHPVVANTLILFDNLPERRMSYKLLYEGLKEDVQSLKNVIDLGSKENEHMKDYIVKLEKTVAACDTKTTEKLLNENARLKNLSEELMEKVTGLER